VLLLAARERLGWPPTAKVPSLPGMFLALTFPVLLAALGFSIIYLLLGGGLGGAVLIFIVAKMLRR
jgi:hypothetical protein